MKNLCEKALSIYILCKFEISKAMSSNIEINCSFINENNLYCLK